MALISELKLTQLIAVVTMVMAKPSRPFGFCLILMYGSKFPIILSPLPWTQKNSTSTRFFLIWPVKKIGAFLLRLIALFTGDAIQRPKKRESQNPTYPSSCLRPRVLIFVLVGESSQFNRESLTIPNDLVPRHRLASRGDYTNFVSQAL